MRLSSELAAVPEFDIPKIVFFAITERLEQYGTRVGADADPGAIAAGTFVTVGRHGNGRRCRRSRNDTVVLLLLFATLLEIVTAAEPPDAADKSTAIPMALLVAVT